MAASDESDVLETYALAWRETRRRRRQLLAWWLGVPILGFAVLALLGLLVPEERASLLDTLGLAVAVVWGLGFFVLAFRHALFPCPRCGQSFYARGLRGDPFATWCRHCNLPKGASGPDVPDFVLKRK